MWLGHIFSFVCETVLQQDADRRAKLAKRGNMTRAKLYFLFLHFSLLKATDAQQFPFFALVEDQGISSTNPLCAGVLFHPDLILSDSSCENKWAGQVAKIGVEDREKPETIPDIVAVEKEIQGIPGLPGETLIVKLERKSTSGVANFATVEPGEGTLITKAGFKSVLNASTTISTQNLSVMSLADCRFIVGPIYNIDAFYTVTNDMLCADVQFDECIDDLGSVVFDAGGNVVGFGQQNFSVCRDDNAPVQELPTVYRSVADYAVALEKAICRYSDDRPVSCPDTPVPTASPSASPTTQPPTESPSMAPTLTPERNVFEMISDFFIGIYDFFVVMFFGEPTEAPSLSPTQAPTPALVFDSDDDPGAWCFSSQSTVQVLHKGEIPMEKLEIGDQVLTSVDGETYSRVYSFGHKVDHQIVEYLQIYTSTTNDDDDDDSSGKNNKKKPLEISAEHLLYVVKDSASHPNLVPARDVAVGDTVLITSTSTTIQHHSKVQSIGKVTRRGAYAPITTSGDIVVNGVVASNYVTLPPTSRLQSHLSLEQQHWVQHAAYAPYRVYCQTIGNCQNETYHETTGLSAVVMWWMPLLGWLEQEEACPEVVLTMLVFGVTLVEHFRWMHLLAAAVGYYVLVWKSGSSSSSRNHCDHLSEPKIDNEATLAENKVSPKAC